MTRIWKWAACAAIFSFTLAGCAPVESEVDSVTPAPGTVTESAEVIIVVDFSHSMSAESITTSTFMVVGSESGKVSGSFAFYAGETQVEFTPTVPFIEGEVVTVTLSDAISSQSDKNLDPYSWSFDIVPPVVIPPTPIQIVSTAPMIESNSGARSGLLQIGVNTPFNPFSIGDDTVRVEGSRSGRRDVSFVDVLLSFDILKFNVDRPFIAGERVSMVLTPSLEGVTGGQPLESLVQFTVRNSGSLWPAATHASGTALAGGQIVFFDSDSDGLEEWATISPAGIVTVQDVTITGLGNVTSWDLDQELAGAAAGDFDADGRVDLVVLSASGDRIMFFRGSASLALLLENPLSLPLDQPATGLISGHCDSDGTIDLVLFDDAGVSIAWGDNLNPLESQSALPALSPIGAPAVGDFDADALPDLAVAIFGGDIAILRNLGDRSFHHELTLLPSTEATGVLALSLDGDDLTDLVATTGEGEMSTAFLPVGGLDFDAVTLFTNAAGTGAVAADWNGDGDIDLLAPVADGSGVRISLGMGDGNLLSPTVQTTSGIVTWLRLGDTNGDGVLDLATVNDLGEWKVALGDAANPPLINRIRVGDLSATSGETGVPFVVTADSEVDLEAYTLVLDFDPTLVSMQSFSTFGTDAANFGAEFEIPNIDNATGTAILAVIVDFLPPFDGTVLPSGLGLTVAGGFLSIDGSAPSGSTLLAPTDGLGTPPTDNSFVNGGLTITPTELLAGTLTITGGTAPPPPGPEFIRGDANFDGLVDLSDAPFLQNYLSAGGSAPPCFDAADANDDGIVNVADAIFLYDYLFSGASAPPMPFPLAGSDPTTDSLNCSP